MFNTEIKFNSDMQKEMLYKSWILGLIMTIVGGIGSVAYIILSTFMTLTSKWVEYLLIFSVALGFGLVLILSVKKAIKKTGDKDIVNKYHFSTEGFKVESFTSSRLVGSSVVAYRELLFVKITKNYLFFYVNFQTAFPISKTNIGIENMVDLIAVLNNLNIRIKS